MIAAYCGAADAVHDVVCYDLNKYTLDESKSPIKPHTLITVQVQSSIIPHCKTSPSITIIYIAAKG